MSGAAPDPGGGGPAAAADRQQLERWWSEVLAAPFVLPVGVRSVQSRLVRAVGCSELPGGTRVFLKMMGFPRVRDRLRYAARALPAVREARVLRYLAERGIRVPLVVDARGARRRGLPHASLLVTRGLPVAAEQVLRPDPVLDVLFAVRDAGVFHPDLHSDNFVSLADGSVAVLDMQSARRRRVGVAGTERMLATLLAHQTHQGAGVEPWCEALGRRGHDAGSVQRICALARRINTRALRRRLHRCLDESTGFTVRRGLLRSRFTRRSLEGRGEWVEGGGELMHYWLGDRALEVLGGEAPVLAALERPHPFVPGRHRVRLEGGAAALTAAAPRLRAGFQRYREALQPVE